MVYSYNGIKCSTENKYPTAACNNGVTYNHRAAQKTGIKLFVLYYSIYRKLQTDKNFREEGVMVEGQNI